jgi:hypothetical protein
MSKLQMLYHLNLGITNATVRDSVFLETTTTKALNNYCDFKDLRTQAINMIESNNYKGLINTLNELYKEVESTIK